MNLDDKRKIEAEITKKFLADNKNIVASIIQKFGTIMNSTRFNSANSYNFYLKGGNALSILDGKPTTGDFDFQLGLPESHYINWVNEFLNVDVELVRVLKETVEGVAKDKAGVSKPFDETCFEVSTLQGWTDPGQPLAGINLTSLTKVERIKDIMKIGREFGDFTYDNILGSNSFIDGRITLNQNPTVSSFDLIGENFGPSVYVNYTIPGFILYRMVYCYRYTLVDEKTKKLEQINLKSEIIDVSIPRVGSAEVYMSQEGVVTHFRHSGSYPFNIPGWGYHFYENINLLQEIELGISGSPHKETKRKDRLNQALEKLMLENKKGEALSLDDILQLTINEPNGEGGYTAILGYFGALTFNIDDYGGRYNFNATADLQIRIFNTIESYYYIANIYFGQSKYADYQKLVYFKLNKKFDKTVRNSKEARSCIMNFMRECGTPFKYNMEENKSFQFISPLMSGEGGNFAFDYIVIQIISTAFDDLKKYLQVDKRYRDFEQNNVFEYAINEWLTNENFKRVYHVIFQKCRTLTTLPINTNTEGFLRRSILESQRYALAETLKPKVKQSDFT